MFQDNIKIIFHGIISNYVISAQKVTDNSELTHRIKLCKMFEFYKRILLI